MGSSRPPTQRAARSGPSAQSEETNGHSLAGRSMEGVSAVSSWYAPAADDADVQHYTATLKLDPSQAQVGHLIEATGAGYAPGAEVDLVWYTVRGHYELDGGTEFIGQRYERYAFSVGTTVARHDGSIETAFEVPVGFGGMHDVRGRTAAGEVAQAGLQVDPTLSLTPTEGPIGTLVELRIVGVDQQINLNTWHILYDNRYLGFASAVTTDGVAVARFRAAGAPGRHYVAAWNNSYNSAPYLAWSTSPFRYISGPGSTFCFQVTEEPGSSDPLIEEYSATDEPWPQNTRGPARLSLSVDRGPVGRSTTLRGRKLPPNTTVTLLWSTTVGDRVTGVGQTHQTRSLGEVTIDPEGTFVKDLTIPDDLGGQHRIEVKAGEEFLGSVGLVIQPSIVSIGPLRLQQGEEISFHLKGLGWTTYDNTYTVTYDNAFIGYICGFSTAGDVKFKLTATGERGTHIIDLYPTIFKGREAMPRLYSLPQLTYATDHPARTIPAIRLSLEVIE